jgi:hypothetical protein
MRATHAGAADGETVEESRGCGRIATGLLDVLFFFFLVVIFENVVPILGLLIVFVIVIVRDGIDLDGVNLHDFHLGFALRTGQDFTFLDFVFVNIDFSGAFRTPDHGENLLAN